MNKKKNRSIIQLFAHLEGIAVVPTIKALSNYGITDILLDKNNISLRALSKEKSAQVGYLNVALNTLASLGVLKKKLIQDDVYYSLTPYGKEYLKYIESYSFYANIVEELNNFIINDIKRNDLDIFIKKTEQISVDILSELKKLHSQRTEMHTRIAHHIEGILIFPPLLYISHDNSDLKNTIYLKGMIKNILSQDYNINSNEVSNYILSRSKSYGVTASYQPIFSNLDEIIFNNKNLLYSQLKNTKELHVNRRLNVWGSGGAHKTYFKKIDSIIIDIFNMPIETQPSGIADMGCGDGMFLEHLNKVILSKTKRGQHLNTHPLTLIGADLNQEALNVAKKNLWKSRVDCNFIIADVSSPEKYKNDLKINFNINITDLLHVRSFLDHNRIYEENENKKDSINLKSMCSYSYKGKYLSSEDITSNLINHFSLWKRYINKHGLLLLELHGMAPSLSTLNKSYTPTIAYEATHGYSDQFIVEYDVFMKCTQIAELVKIEEYSKVFPTDELVTISLNLFK